MKYLFLTLFLVATMLASCDKKDDSVGTPPSCYIEDSSYIMAYTYGDPKLLPSTGFLSREDRVLFRGLINLSLYGEEGECFSPEFYNTFGQDATRQSEEAERRFLETASENGDLHYTGRVGYVHFAFARHLREIHLTCNVDWDEAHPAGTLLDDIFYMTCYPYASFFKSNYTEWNVTTKKLSQFTPEDLYIANSNSLIRTLYTPDHLFGKEITFFLQVVMDDGRIVESQCSYEGEDWQELPGGITPTI